MLKIFVLMILFVSNKAAPFLCNSLNLSLTIFDHGSIVLAGNIIFSVNLQNDGQNALTFTELKTSFTKNISLYYFGSELFMNPDYHFCQGYTGNENGQILISNDTMDIKFWYYIKKDLYHIPSYFVIDQGSISYQSGEMIGKGDSLDTSLWNSTDIWNDEITTNIIHNCVSYNVAPIPTNNKQCSKFVITSHIYNVTNNNNLLGTVVSKMNVNNDTLDISNDFTSLSNSKFAFNVNFYYTTNYTKGSSNLSIPLTGNRKYIFMLNFEVDSLAFVFEYLGKFIKRDQYFLMEEGLSFSDESKCLTQNRFLTGSHDLQLRSFMCCFS